jgi:hypothetical protein
MQTRRAVCGNRASAVGMAGLPEHERTTLETDDERRRNEPPRAEDRQVGSRQSPLEATGRLLGSHFRMPRHNSQRFADAPVPCSTSSMSSSQGLPCPAKTNLEQKQTKETKREGRGPSDGWTACKSHGRPAAALAARARLLKTVQTSPVLEFFVCFAAFCSRVLAGVAGVYEAQSVIEQDCPRKARKYTETESQTVGSCASSEGA